MLSIYEQAKRIKKYLQRTNQTVPSKLIIHKTTPYHPEEVQGIKDGMAGAGFQGEFAMVHLKNDTGYKTYRKDNYTLESNTC